MGRVGFSGFGQISVTLAECAWSIGQPELQSLWLTFKVKSEEEEEQASDQVPKESDHSAGDAFRDWVHRLNEELEEYWHAAVDKYAHQDAGSVQDGCKSAKGTKWAAVQLGTLM